MAKVVFTPNMQRHVWCPFGFAVVVHPREPDTAWFIPEIKDEKRVPREGKLVVTRTLNGGKRFDVLGNGLPQSHA